MNSQMIALERAIDLGGGIVKFCKALGITHQAVNGGWRKRGYVPLPRAVDIEAKFGVAVDDLIDPDLAAKLKAASIL